MPKKHQLQEKIEVQADMKVLLEVERFSGASEVKGRYFRQVLAVTLHTHILSEAVSDNSQR